MLWLPSLNFATLSAPARAGGSLVLPLHSRIVFEGDSITAGSSGPQFSMFALIRAMGRFFSPSGWNQGVGGQTAAQMATQVANVTALNPKVVVLLCGTNDLSGTADTAATIFANIRTCVDAYRAAGAKVVSVCVLPRNDGVWDAGEETPEERFRRARMPISPEAHAHPHGETRPRDPRERYARVATGKPATGRIGS